MDRRSFVSTCAAGFLIGTAGCLNTIRGGTESTSNRSVGTLYGSDSAWPSYGADAGNTGSCDASLVTDPVLRTHRVDAAMPSMPGSEFLGVTVADNRVYTPGREQLVCHDLDEGRTVWTESIDSEVSSTVDSVPIVTEEVVYLTLWNPARTVAVDRASGERLWEREAFVWKGSAAVTDALHALGDRRRVTAFDPETGDIVWQGEETGYRALAVDDGTVYATRPVSPEAEDRVTEGALTAVADGEQLWERDDLPRLLSVPVADDDLVLVWGETGTVHGIETDTGETRWTVAHGDPGPNQVPAVSADRVYLPASVDHPARCLDRDSGESCWELDIRRGVQPVVAADGVYVPTYQAGTHALERDGSHVWHEPAASTFHGAGAVDGSFVVISGDGHLAQIE